MQSTTERANAILPGLARIELARLIRKFAINEEKLFVLEVGE